MVSLSNHEQAALRQAQGEGEGSDGCTKAPCIVRLISCGLLKELDAGGDSWHRPECKSLKTIIMHNGHILRPVRYHYMEYVLQKCDLCGYIWETIDDCAASNLKCTGVPRRIPIIGRIDQQYGWRKIVGAFFFLLVGLLLYGLVIENGFYPGELGFLIAHVVILVIALFLALLFWPNQ